jgi:hypothetical protein
MDFSLRFRHAQRLASLAVRLIAVLLLMVAAAHGQPGASQITGGPSASEAKRHSVRGTVVNSVSGEPIARAFVSLIAGGEKTAMTDATGAFHFEDVPEGSAIVAAERPGFSLPDDRPRPFPISGDIDGLTIPLMPQAVISGRIASIQNVPIEDLPVHLYRRVYVNGRVQWQTANVVASDDDGEFRIASLTPGAYCLSVGPESWRERAPGSRPHGYPQVFYPNAADFSSASVISVAAGQQVEADLSMTQEPLFEVSGQVVGVPPGTDVAVQLMSGVGELLPIRQMHSERHDFSAFVAPGRYLLKAFASIEAQSLSGSSPVTVTANTAGIQVVLGPRTAIPVNVHADSGGGRDQPLANVSVTLLPTPGGSNLAQIWTRPIAGRRGSFEIVGAEATTYSVDINAYGRYVVSATSGSTDLLHTDLVVGADGSAEPIEITLASDGGDVSGTVHLPGGMNGATVLLVPERAPAGQVRSANVEANGEFQFEQVRPGDYSLLALEHGDDLEYQNPDVLSSYSSSATRISVSPKQQVKATLELISPEK